MIRPLFPAFLTTFIRRRQRTATIHRSSFRPKLEALEERLAPAVLTINSLADNTTSGNGLTLREAIMVVDGTLGRSLNSTEQAQVVGTLGSNDTIQFNLPAGPQTITLTGGALSITRPVSIVGPGPGSLTINGNNANRIFAIGTSQNLRLVAAISGLTLTAGNANSASIDHYGGALLNFGTTTVTNCTFANNTAAAGGAISSEGTLTVNNSTFTANQGASDGGAIYNYHGSSILTVNNSSFLNNTSGSDGGAIRSNVQLVLSNSTFYGNVTSSQGGGLSTSDQKVTVSNCTFANNTAGSEGGGIEIESGARNVSLLNDTIAGNRVKSSSSGVGGGVRADYPATLDNTLVAGNFRGSGSTADDIGGSVSSSSAFNLLGTGGAGGLSSGNSNQVGVSNPGLGTLASNGGPTQTVALLPGSPAIDHGSNAFVTSGATDQRGLPRIVNGTVDIGAFEVQSTSGVTGLTITGLPATIQAGTVATITLTATTASGTPATGYLGTVHFTSSDGQAGLPTDYTFVSADNGVHSFTLTFRTAGSQSLGVTDTASTSLSAQAGATVTPAAASVFALTGFPTTITAGVAGQFTVTARDAFGNTATGYTGTIHFTSSDPQAVLPADSTLTAGVGTFSATFATAGSQSLTATDTATPSITGTQAGITVNAVTTSGGTVLTVNSLADSTTADNFLTLREAILLEDGTLGRSLTAAEQAQISGPLSNNDTIQFSLPAGPQTITLTGGALQITHAVTIAGPGASALTINGNNHDRVFLIGQIWSPNRSLVAAISGLTITGGSQTYGGGLLNFGTLTVSNATFANNTAGSSGGGGIYNVGALTLNNCAFTGNVVTASAAGGGIENISSGTASLTNCTFTSNSAAGSGSSASSGAGIANSGTMTIAGCTFTSNVAASDGGAIYNDGTLTIGTTSFTNNSAGADGGAIRSGGTLTVSASTFAGNTASSVGGGLDTSDANVSLTNCTFATNTAGSAGGAIQADSGSGTASLINDTITANRVTSSSSSALGAGINSARPVTLHNTIVGGNVQGSAALPSDIAGTVNTTSSFNLIGTGGSGGLVNGVNNNQVGVVNLGLGALANNGGPTMTIALLPGSPALDQGSNTYVTAGETDERGLPRVVNGTVDIGAFEAQ